MSATGASAAERYLRHAAEVLSGVLERELPAIAEAADLWATAIEGGGLLHVFGTGHSHMVAEELFYRAGGLVAVNPILDERLMLHVGALESTRLERLDSIGADMAAGIDMRPGDALLIASNSGGNAVGDAVARRGVELGVPVVAIVSRRHAASLAHDRSARLCELATVVIDNHGNVGDAAIAIDGVEQRVGPTSTVSAAAIVNAIAAEVVERLARRGVPTPILASSNVAGGDAHNAAVIAAYRDRVRSL